MASSTARGVLRPVAVTLGLDEDVAAMIAVAIGAVLFWELLKRVLGRLRGSAALPPQIFEVPPEYKDLPVPPDPHFEMALHPPQGLAHSNPKKPYDYDCEHCHGTYLFFHTSTGPNTTHGPNDFDYGEYFQCKSRLWEMRIHMKFRSVPEPDEDLFFGIELDKFVPMSRGTQQAQKVIVAGIKQAIGGLYHSAGDRPGAASGEQELPVCVLPLWAFDQFIVTPEGEDPPDLWDKDFSNFGSKRYQRIKEYAEEIKDLQRNLAVGPTYTFSFWGNSRFLDVLNWTVIGIPLVTPVSFDNFAGKAPVHVMLYSLKKDAKESRHLRSRKKYYFRAAVWSSLFRPEKRRIEALTGRSYSEPEEDLTPSSSQGKPKSLKRRMAGFLRRFEGCTGPRTKD